jgi:Uma2 family endonuclease
MTTITFDQIIGPEGERLLLKDVSWQQFEAILTALGEHHHSRIAYYQGFLEIMSPLPKHELDKIYISNFIEILLEELDREFCPLGSTTFKNEFTRYGIEPNNFFYIDNEYLIRGKERLDLTIDPAPYLALEIDVTYSTNTNIYQALGVRELWIFAQEKLQIYNLHHGQYIPVKSSLYFYHIPVITLIPEYLKRCQIDGRNKTMRAFRNLVKNNLLKDCTSEN